MTREEAVKILEYPVNKWSIDWDERDDGLSYTEALEMAISALRAQQEQAASVCEFCTEDKDGYVKKIGAFSLSEPFHKGEYFLCTKHCKPRKINFCPMCGRKLGDAVFSGVQRAADAGGTAADGRG